MIVIQGMASMVNYCETVDGCRKQLISAHFSQNIPPCEDKCDLCLNPNEVYKIDVIKEIEWLTRTSKCVPIICL